MGTQAMNIRTGLYSSNESVILTQALIEQFLNTIKMSGRQPQTVLTYRRGLEDLYDFLPEKKEVTKDLLENWRESLKKSGYSDCTINTKLAAANGLLRYCGTEKLLASYERVALDETMPELTRDEYLQFLSKVCEIGSEKYYFLIKVFASIDIGIGKLDCLTVEACRDGVIYMSDEAIAEIPVCLREELLQYADRNKIIKGPLFVTRDGTLMDRCNITNTIRRLAIRAGMNPDACCPSALHRLYLSTQKELSEQMHPLFVQNYESLLNTEQAMVAWHA